MPNRLSVTVGQYSTQGRKNINQDFHGVCLPQEPQLSSKGIAVALADGISSSDVGDVASASAVKTFLDDYYCTSEAWSVKTSAQRVLAATNSWLYSQTQKSQYRYDKDRGYVCTFSGLVFKSATAHLFHVGDSRIYRIRDGRLEQLTQDHRLVVAEDQSYLSRALGISPQLDIDYQTLPLEVGDVYVCATDGVYEHVAGSLIIDTIVRMADDLDAAARQLCDAAYDHGSLDNLTLQIARIDALPQQTATEVYREWADLPPAPLLEARMQFDGYQIIRQLHGSSRSHIYLASDLDTAALVAIKIPSIDLRGDPAYLERFMLEEWIARRITSAHVLKPCPHTRKRKYLYVIAEYIDGKTLAQWMIDNPAPDIDTVRGIVEQISMGLLAFHRMEMLHQDLRPNNIMVDSNGTVKIIDFGSASVSGLTEAQSVNLQPEILGTVQYTAPEYFVGEPGTPRSDLFSLGVITYQMLCGRLPFGAEVAKTRTKAAQKKLQYASVLNDHREIPAWIDPVLAKAVHPDPYQRYGELSEFLYDLRHPNPALMGKRPPPLIKSHPLLFWQLLSGGLGVLVLILLRLLMVK